ncbi:hypothetical protein [Chryseobacterium sp. Mn2064]|uniref:hypothetical protein n=1 Tax=Chryseobacterium sp. Mn2064 TaxID=3395263 RepID=UPI003BE6FA60
MIKNKGSLAGKTAAIIRKIFIVSFIAQSIFLFSQNLNEDLAHYLQDADSIVLTSHADLILETERPGKSTVRIKRSLLKDGIPNSEIIRKKALLTLEAKQELINIITGQKKNKPWDGNYCFEPHNTLFIYKASQWSYIDFCFGCDHYYFSKEIPVNKEEFLMTYEDWRTLDAFFQKQGVHWDGPMKDIRIDRSGK